MNVKLGINTGFALNRFPRPEDWIPLVSEEFGIKIVQFTADLLNPSLPQNIISNNIERIKKFKQAYDVDIQHTFTGAFTRVNHLAHPDPEIREYWKKWFFKFVDISCALGALDMGSHLGILSMKDVFEPVLREERFMQVVKAWKEISEYAKQKGLKYLTWEPMSIKREMGETIGEAERIQNILNSSLKLPVKLCLDVDHGDLESGNSIDTDPYEWLKKLGKQAALLHIKQSLEDKGGHWPFTKKYNELGKITPQKLLKVIQDAGINEITLLLELSFREREPFDSNVISDIKESVEYWRPFVSI
ncbi:sugar phosphate isomerase/epimerase family protein [bacterium]